MNAKINKATTAAQRKLALRRWRRWAVQFETTLLRQLNTAPKIPNGGTGLLAIVVGAFDKKSEFIQIFHPGGPPSVFKNLIGEGEAR
jgi:hypothetical protein